MTARLEEPIERRDFLGIAALGAFASAVALAVTGVLRLPRPTLLPEPSKRYKVGDPAAFPAGEVRKPEGRNVYVIHDEEGFYSLSSVCTHLGCIVTRSDRGYECPCHGSSFDGRGGTVSGPAPRGLDWYALSIAPDGQLVVDEGKRVKAGTFFRV